MNSNLQIVNNNNNNIQSVAWEVDVELESSILTEEHTKTELNYIKYSKGTTMKDQIHDSREIR